MTEIIALHTEQACFRAVGLSRIGEEVPLARANRRRPPAYLRARRSEYLTPPKVHRKTLPGAAFGAAGHHVLVCSLGHINS